MEVCYIVNKDKNTLEIYPKGLVQHELFRQLALGIKMANPNFDSTSEIEINKEIEKINRSNDQELIDLINEIKKDFDEMLNSTTIPSEQFGKVIVFSGLLRNSEFLEENKQLLNDKHLLVALNALTFSYSSTDGDDNLKNSSIIDVVSYTNDNDDPLKDIQKQNLESKIFDLLPIIDKIKFRSIKFLENYDSKITYSFEELMTADKKIEQVVKVINSYKNLSPYEKFCMAYCYVNEYQYNKVEESYSAEISRSLLSILNSDKIVCAGKANLLKAILDKLDIPSIYRGCDGHAICTVAINDPKYNIFGIYNCDPTNIIDPNLFDDKNPLYKDLFVNVKWINKLTHSQEYYLMRDSKLNLMPQQVLQESTKRFARRDELLKLLTSTERHTIPSFKDRVGFKRTFQKLTNIINDVLQETDTNDQIFERIKKWKEAVTGIQQDFNIKTGELSHVIDNVHHYFEIKKSWQLLKERLQREQAGQPLTADEEFVIRHSAEFEEMGLLNSNVESQEFNSVYAEKYLQNCNIKPTEEAVAQALEQLKQKITVACEEINKIYEPLDNQIEGADQLESKPLINISNALRALSEAHATNNESKSKAILIGARLDGIRTWEDNPTKRKKIEEDWRKIAIENGLNPDEILPTLDRPDFTVQPQSSTREE